MQDGPPQYPLYQLDDVRGRMADVLETTARAYDSLRDSQQAVAYFERAAIAFDEVGQQEHAERCRVNIARIRAADNPNLDQEITRLQGLLETLPESSLKHVEALISLGELHAKEGDDYEATQLLQKAQVVLQAMGHGDPGDQDAAAVLRQSVQRIMSGQHSGGPTQIETLVWVRTLYQRLYLALAQLFRETDPDRASDYSQRLERLERTDMTEHHLGQVIDALGEDLRRFRQESGPSSSFLNIR